MSEPLPSKENEAEVAFTTKPVYEMLLTNGVTVESICATLSLHNTEAGARLLNESRIHLGCKICTGLLDLSKLRTDMRQPLQKNESVLPNLRLGNLITRIGLVIALLLAVNILLSTALIDQSIR